jgi:hypothetical protein
MTVLTLQPDETSSNDIYIESGAPTTNQNAQTVVSAGEFNAGANITRTLIKFDLSSIPAGVTINSAVLSLYATTDLSSNARTFRVFRQLRAWVESQATWNIYSTGNNWATAGGFGATDCEQTDIGTRAFTATETLNEFKDFTLTASEVQEMITGGGFTNNGFLIKADTETDDQYLFAGSGNATASLRPKLVIDYNFAQAAAGTLTSSGAITKKTGKAVAGTLTSSGGLVRKALKALAGTLTSSGALGQNIFRNPSGVFARILLGRRIAKVLATSLSEVSTTFYGVGAFLEKADGDFLLKADGDKIILVSSVTATASKAVVSNRVGKIGDA